VAFLAADVGDAPVAEFQQVLGAGPHTLVVVDHQAGQVDVKPPGIDDHDRQLAFGGGDLLGYPSHGLQAVLAGEIQGEDASSNTIRFAPTTATGLANVDYLDVGAAAA
jgi:hypothetical protein